jgi:hypothetical protein
MDIFFVWSPKRNGLDTPGMRLADEDRYYREYGFEFNFWPVGLLKRYLRGASRVRPHGSCAEPASLSTAYGRNNMSCH